MLQSCCAVEGDSLQCSNVQVPVDKYHLGSLVGGATYITAYVHPLVREAQQCPFHLQHAAMQT